MFSWIRFFGGMLSLLAFVVYCAVAFSSNLSATPAQEIETTVRFYEEAATSWSEILAILCSLVWITSTIAHGLLLMSSRNPQRMAAMLAILGLVGTVVFAYVSLIQGTAGPESGSKTPDWMFWIGVLLPLSVQILDVVLPPWPWTAQKLSVAAH